MKKKILHLKSWPSCSSNMRINSWATISAFYEDESKQISVKYGHFVVDSSEGIIPSISLEKWIRDEYFLLCDLTFN